MNTVSIIVTAIFASTGFWAFMTRLYDQRTTKKSASARMLKGLAHDRICSLGEIYIKRGYITKDEYENLHDYLFVPYEALDGNGTAAKIMKHAGDLPMREHTIENNKQEETK